MRLPSLSFLAVVGGASAQTQHYHALSTLTNRWGPGTRQCYTDSGVLATAPSTEWTGTLAEAQTRCAANPGCTVVYDWACDGLSWKYCSVATIQHPATSCGYHVAPNPPPSPPSPPLPSVPPAQGAGGDVVIHFPPPPAPPGGYGEAPCAALAILAGRGPVAHCGSTHLQSICDKTFVLTSGGHQPCVFEYGACHHGATLLCSPPSSPPPPPPPNPAPPPLPALPLPCPELANVWGREITYMHGPCSYYNGQQTECNRRYRLHSDGTRSACMYSSKVGMCIDIGQPVACPPSPPGLPQPPSPPFVQTVHPASASTQIVLADTFQTGAPGRRTYRPVQYLLSNGYPVVEGPRVTDAMVAAGTPDNAMDTGTAHEPRWVSDTLQPFQTAAVGVPRETLERA